MYATLYQFHLEELYVYHSDLSCYISDCSASVSLRRSVNDYMLFHKLNSTVNKNDVHM
jgi:hypothetical protein